MCESQEKPTSVDAAIERENINSWDWTHAERYCRAYLDRELHKMSKTYEDDSRAYTTAIVVSYARPFSGNKDREGRRDRVNAEYVDALPEKARAIHDRIVDLRNTTFAHSDAKYHDVQVRETESGGLTTFSHDPLVPLEKSEVQTLLSNVEIFKAVNAKLRTDAHAKHHAMKKAK